MFNLFKRIKIRAKLLLAFGSIILLSVLLTVYAFTSIAHIMALESLKEESEKLSINLERIELAGKEFIYEGYKAKDFQEKEKSEILDRYELALHNVNNNLKFISEDKYLNDPVIKKTVQSLYKSKVISESFYETKTLLKQRGFKDYGLEGSLRAAIHKIESSSFTYNRADMLMLRRHEKDFFLRKDLKYQTEFNKSIDAFTENLKSEGNSELLELLADYQNKFNRVVGIEKEIGLTDKEGKKGELFAKLQEVRTSIETIQQKIHESTREEIQWSRVSLFVIFSVQFIAAIILAIAYSNVLTSVIKEIKTTMSQLANGIFPAPLKVVSSEEIGQTKNAINQFLERLKNATSFAEKLGNGELNAVYDKRFNNDVFAQALIQMQNKLSEAEVVQSKINWHNEGIVKFNEAIKNNEEELSLLADNILRMLVPFMNANQAAIYVVNREEQQLEWIAAYAYNKRRIREEKLSINHGLIGQCVKEKETIYVTDVPNNYVKITSGLGEATPRNLIIVPLKNGEEVDGVIEMASFSIFEDYHRAFIEKVAETIASIIASRQTSAQTKKLLEESKLKAENLALQEEEMRQTAEELQTTQEEMNRQRKEMELEIKNLKERLKQYEDELVA